MSDSSHVITYQPLQIQEDKQKPMQIFDQKIKKLRKKIMPSVKVLWRSQQVEEETWEPEEDMRHSYPHLFQSTF